MAASEQGQVDNEGRGGVELEGGTRSVVVDGVEERERERERVKGERRGAECSGLAVYTPRDYRRSG